MNLNFRWAAILLVALLSVSCWAQDASPEPAATLHIGDPAPPIVVDKWLKGAPLASYSPSQAYVVVFWSTWCAAFLPAMEHMDELEGQFNTQVQMVAVSVFESNRAKLYGYVNSFASKMDFSVAADKITDEKKHGLDGVMAQTWLEASREYALPIAFIVDHAGRIAWIGSPIGSSIDDPLRRIVDGSWNTAAFAEKFNSEMERQKQMTALRDEMGEAIKTNNWDQAFKDSDEMAPFDQVTASSARYFIMLKKGDFDGAYAYCGQLADGPFARDSRALYSLGWVTLAQGSPWQKTDYDLALDVLKKAVDLSYQKNAEILDALAWAYYDKGDKPNATATEKLALNVARTDQLTQLNQNLKTFQSP